MRGIKIIVLLLIPIFSFGIIPGNDSTIYNKCEDSTLYKKLIEYSDKNKLSESEFRICKPIFDSLDGCQFLGYYSGNQFQTVSSLTFLYGKICYKTNTTSSIHAYLDYHIRHIGSAEEQISFSFEPLFSLRPKLILDEILNQSEKFQKQLLNSLVWGFLNNHYLGIEDPYKDDPYKAMTRYDDPPEPIMNLSNYKEIFYKVHPNSKELYEDYKNTFDYIFNEIKLSLEWQEERNNKTEK
ncbi:MAG: hypothetical protein JEY97_04585 [Bacteroidales bacterium]|nr:hypothetical protein [Bacteroidales bacterium]